MAAALGSLLACPRCRGELEASEEAFDCRRCGVKYPVLAGVPCLLPDPQVWRWQVAGRLDEYLEFTGARLEALRAEAMAPDLLSRTRQRLRTIAEALEVERNLFAELVGPLRPGTSRLAWPRTASIPNAGALALLGCYEHVFRDWAWGEHESKIALGIAKDLLIAQQEDPLRRLVLLGAGAGRLAADLHGALELEHSVALDVNPLPLLVAERLVRGGELRAFEFPIAPLGAAQVAVPRHLRAATPFASALTFVFADGLLPPFRRNSVEAVLTPWFIDAVDADLRVTTAVINGILKPGGRWVSFGPLRFSGTTGTQYTLEEMEEIVTGAGFEIHTCLRRRVPYFASPDSGFERREVVYGFAARKVADARVLARQSPGTEWLHDPELPVPELPEWEPARRAATITEVVLSLAGRRLSILEMAGALGKQWELPPRELVPELQSFLARLLAR